MGNKFGRYLATVLAVLLPVLTYARDRVRAEVLINEKEAVPAGIRVDRPVQGFAVHGRYAFSFHDGGQCIVYDIRRRTFVNSFMLEVGSAHCNSANFGKKKGSGGFPYLYLSECGAGNACFVCEVSTDTIKVIQTIRYTGADADRYFDWSIDASRGLIYTYGGQHMKAKRVRSFRLPDIEEGDVFFTENDVIQSWTVDAVMIAQGNHISRGVMYLPDGPVPQDMDSGLAGRRALHAFDLASGNTESWMLESFSHEPEDISIFRKRVYLQDYGGKEKGGTVYRVHFLK